MSAQTKILIGLIAVVAFAVGISYNTAQVSNAIDTEALLNAELIVADFPIADEPEPFSSSTVRDALGELTLVNFWASWCSPCREEMPLFESMYRQSKADGFVVVGVAIDSPDKTQAMLDSMDISYPILYAEETGMSIMDTAGNPQALLPYSLLLDKDGKAIEQVLGRIHEQQIVEWVAEHL